MYLVKKIFSLLTTLFAVTTLTFFLSRAVPGDPFTNDQAIPKEILEALHRYYGLDQSLFTQYIHYLDQILHFDFGPSLRYQGRTTNDIIFAAFPVSFALGFQAFFLAIIAGVSIGVLGALHRLKWQDRICFAISIAATSIPSFLMAIFLQYGLAVQMEWLPIARWGSFYHSVLPSIALAAFPAAVIARLVRTRMIEVLNQDYILSARAKGLSRFRILWRHALPNSLIPVMAYIGPLATTLFTGSFAVEKIFGIPGLGEWIVSSVSNRDYPVILGITLFYAAFLLISVFIVDLLFCYLNPKINVFKKSYE